MNIYKARERIFSNHFNQFIEMKYLLLAIYLLFNLDLIGQSTIKIYSDNGLSKITYIISQSSDEEIVDLIISGEKLGVSEYSFKKKDIQLSYDKAPPFITFQCKRGKCIAKKSSYAEDANYKTAIPILLTNNKEENDNFFTQLNQLIYDNKEAPSKPAPGTIAKVSIPLSPLPSGTFGISVLLNNTVRTEFILDSGASLICINSGVFNSLLKSGSIKSYDWLGTIKSSIADGSIVENAMINLNSVQIAGFKFRNVQCIVSQNPNAPLLLGQNILRGFGAISIDYENNKLHILN